MSSFAVQARLCAIAACLVTFAAPVAAQPQGSNRSFADRVEPWIPAAALGASIALAVALDVPECRWCDRDAQGRDTLNGFDGSVRLRLLWSEDGRRRADTISDVTLTTLYALPTAVLLSDRPWDRGWQGVRMVFWSFAANTTVTAGVKRLAARERPLVHFDDVFADQGSEPFGSFPSGHTSASFVSVFAAASACRVLDCGHERRIWLVGLPVAALTGYLRIAADKHYATDVLAGAAVGASLGWIVPRLVKAWTSDNAPHVTVLPAMGTSGPSFTVQWTLR